MTAGPRSSEELARQAVWEVSAEVAGIGTYTVRLPGGELEVDDRAQVLAGLDGETSTGRAEDLYANIHPDEVDDVVAAVDRAVAAVGAYSTDYRVVHADGSHRWVAGRGRVLADDAGAATAVVGALYDVTAARDATGRATEVLESMVVGYLAMDHDWRITYVNTEGRRVLGAAGRELVGEVLWEVFPATVGTEYETNYRLAVRTGRVVSFDAHYPAPLDAWFELRATPGPDGLALYFLDITARRAAEQARDLAARRLAGLAEAALALAEAGSVEDLVATVAEQGLSALGCDGGAVAVPDPADPTVLLSYITAGFGERARAQYSRLSVDTALPVCVAATTGRRVLLADRAASLAFSPLMEGVGSATGSQAWASLPLRAGPRVIGVLTAGWREPQAFPEEQLSTLEAFAAQCAQALQRLSALDAERTAASAVRSMAEGLQRSLLAALPEPDHLQLAARYHPAASGAQVGGDWYDAFLVPDGSTSLVVGDVIGHDREAAVAMAGVRNVLRGTAHALSEPPAAILSALDRAMAGLAMSALTTAVLAKVEQTPADAARGLRRLHWSNAGHPPPLLVHPDGRAELLDRSPDLLLGLTPGTARHDHVHPLEPGTTVLLYTDGLVERRGEHLDVGLARLAGAAARLATVTPAPSLDDWCDALVTAMTADDDTDDDIALLALRTHPDDRPRPPEAGPEALPAALHSGRVADRRARPVLDTFVV